MNPERKTIIKRILIYPFAILLIILPFAAGNAFTQTALPPELWKNTGDYSFMYFPSPVKSSTEFHIQTNHHFLAYDFKSLRLKDLRVITDPLPEPEAVRKSPDFLPLAAAGDLLEMGLTNTGNGYKISKGCPALQDCQLIESGKFFQRRYLKGLGFEDGGPQAEVNLEISSWPDRLSFILDVKPSVPKNTDTLYLDYTIPENYRNTLIRDGNLLLAVDADGNGFLFMPAVQDVRTDLSNHVFRILFGIMPNQSYRAEVVVIPVMNYKGEPFETLLGNEKGTMKIAAEQISPSTAILVTGFDKARGWYEIFLRNDGPGNNRIERVKMEITNPDDSVRTVRMNYHKTQATGVIGITGISAMIRDQNLNPAGIPVQLSKNWHKKTGDLFEGSWFRGFTMMSIPANTTVSFEFTLVNAMWGKLPAASHAQLCLVGWGFNQLWEESAIGAWGESVCYEPDGGQAQSMVCDVRPLMIQSLDPALKPQKWNWTPNVGGADFFRFYDASGDKQFITRLKTHYKRYSPNLTEVTYAGVTQGNEADYELTTSIYRSDDYVRAIYRIKLKVNEQMDFSRLAIAQVGSESYSYTGEKKFAFGDENGMIEEWSTVWGGSTYRKTGLNTDGEIPWVSMHEAVNRTPTEWGAWANRGIVVREWNARIGGEESKPYFSEYGAVARGTATSLVEINPAPGIKALQPGDYIEAVIVEVIIPQEAGSYYGPNPFFYKELMQNANTWKPVFREAVGNAINIHASKGTVIDTYPPVVEVNASNEAGIEVEGGIGFVPFTFTGLTSYDQFSIKINRNGKEIILSDQEVHGKDYWQTDYDPVRGTWEITYSVPLDEEYNFIHEQSSMILYNDFDEEQLIPWSNPSALVFTDKEDNPLVSGENPSPKVGKAVRGQATHASVRFQLPDYLDLSVNNTFSFKVFFEGQDPPPPVANVRLILRDNNIGSTQYALTQSIKRSNAWDEYVFNCSGASERSPYNQVHLFFCSPDNDGSSTGLTFYVDDLMGPPLTMDSKLVNLLTSTSGDSIIIDFSRNNQKLERLFNPVFVLFNQSTGSIIKTDSITSDSLHIFLHVNKSMTISGRDNLSLSFISGEIGDASGKVLPYFAQRNVTNNIPITSFYAKFILQDAETNAILPDTRVSYDSQSILTNSLGEATILLEAGNYSFSFFKLKYLEKGLALEISGDTVISVALFPSVADVQFLVTDGSNTLSNAKVEMSGQSKWTNALGAAVFSELTINAEYEYIVSLDGYSPVNASLNLVKDTTLSIVLTSTTGTGSQYMIPEIYPNPFRDELRIQLAHAVEFVAVMNLSGAELKRFTDLGPGAHMLQLSELQDGMYILICQGEAGRHYLKVVKQE